MATAKKTSKRKLPAAFIANAAKKKAGSTVKSTSTGKKPGPTPGTAAARKGSSKGGKVTAAKRRKSSK